MVTCGHCGRRMSGVHRKDYNHGEGRRFYHCNPSPLKLGYDPTCPHSAVRSDRLEAFVLEAIRTHLIDAGAEERIRAAIVRSRSKQATQTSQDKRQLAEVRRKIARGTENFALADREDFAGISKLLEEWRAEETRLVEQIERRKDELKPLTEALRVIARFAEYRDQLQKADRVALANALRVTVASITVRVPATRTGWSPTPARRCASPAGGSRSHRPGRAVDSFAVPANRLIEIHLVRMVQLFSKEIVALVNEELLRSRARTHESQLWGPYPVGGSVAR